MEGSPCSPNSAMSGLSNSLDQAWGVSDSEEDDEEDDHEVPDYVPPAPQLPKLRSATRMSAIVNEEIALSNNMAISVLPGNRRLESRYSALSLYKENGTNKSSRNIFENDPDRIDDNIVREAISSVNRDLEYSFAPQLEDYETQRNSAKDADSNVLQAHNKNGLQELQQIVPTDPTQSEESIALSELLNQLEVEDAESAVHSPTAADAATSPTPTLTKPPLTINVNMPMLPKPLLKKTDSGISIMHPSGHPSPPEVGGSQQALPPLTTHIVTAPIVPHHVSILSQLPERTEFAACMQVVHEGWVEKRTNYTGWKKVCYG